MRKDLEIAFRGTRYQVLDAAAEIVLRVDEPSPALQRLLQGLGTVHAALLTAFNPGACQRDDAANHTAQRLMCEELASLGYACIPACNEDPTGKWPAEQSVLVPGLPKEAARAMAACHGQVAFLWCDAADAPRLIEVAPAGAGSGS